MMYLIIKKYKHHDHEDKHHHDDHNEDTHTHDNKHDIIINTKSFLTYVDKHGYHFNRKLSEYASKLMQNVIGDSHTWNCEDVSRELRLMGIHEYGLCTIGDVTYLANMAYADFYPNVLVDENACIRYALAVANDIDGYDGIAFLRWVADLMGKHITNIKWEDYV